MVRPAPGVTTDDLRQGLFDLPGVTSTEAVGATALALRHWLEGVVGILRVLRWVCSGSPC